MKGSIFTVKCYLLLKKPLEDFKCVSPLRKVSEKQEEPFRIRNILGNSSQPELEGLFHCISPSHVTILHNFYSFGNSWTIVTQFVLQSSSLNKPRLVWQSQARTPAKSTWRKLSAFSSGLTALPMPSLLLWAKAGYCVLEARNTSE